MLTPTYSGCPAMHTMEQDVRARLPRPATPQRHDPAPLSPAWTSDWLSPAAQRALREYGIAPPGRGRVSAVWLAAYVADLAVWFHRVQGALSLRRLP